MKITDIKDPALRKQMAELELAYWHACTVEAARLHPMWIVSGDGMRFKRRAGRTGPRKPHTLLNWFLTNHSDKAGQIRDRYAAMLRFSGSVTVKRDGRH